MRKAQSLAEAAIAGNVPGQTGVVSVITLSDGVYKGVMNHEMKKKPGYSKERERGTTFFRRSRET